MTFLLSGGQALRGLKFMKSSSALREIPAGASLHGDCYELGGDKLSLCGD